MFLTYALLVLSLVSLYFGAEFLVKGSASLAVRFGVPPLVIGLTVVAFGTSAPELLVSTQSALAGHSAIAIGNIVGSNIFNICIILGVAAMLSPLAVNRQLLRYDMWILLAVTALFIVLFRFGLFTRLTGILFFAGILLYILFCIRQARQDTPPSEQQESPPTSGWWWDILYIVGGLALLVIGSELLISNAVIIAEALGLSEAVIGLTIVAAGTSMPELATSVVAAIRKRADIAIGNVVGSNIFNLLAVLGVSASISPIRTAEFSTADQLMLLGSTGLLLLFMRTGLSIRRWEGCVLFLSYVGYVFYLLGVSC